MVSSGFQDRDDVLLETERLRLRRFTSADVDDLVALDSDPDVMHFITGGLPTSRSEIEDEVLPHWLRYYSAAPFIGFWAAEDRITGEFLGWFHLRPLNDGDSGDLELGYRLKRSVWGQGLATEGSRALVDLAFTKVGASRVVAESMFAHTASRRVMEKSGLALVRVFNADWPFPIPGDEYGDVEYALTREDWANATQPRALFVVAAVVLRDDRGRVLVVRKRGTTRFMLPGGKIESGETPAQTAVRELREEVGAELDPTALVLLGDWTAPAANEPGHQVHGHVFEHPWLPGLTACAEIEAILWLHPQEMADREDLAPLLETCVLPVLAARDRPSSLDP